MNIILEDVEGCEADKKINFFALKIQNFFSLSLHQGIVSRR